LFQELNDSLPFDRALVIEDIEGSVGWARALRRAGVLKAGELTRLLRALARVRREVEREPGVVLASKAEDVHAFVEQRLIALVGSLGKKLHTGRSRNDQVATDLRLWTRKQIGELQGLISEARRGLLAFAEQHADVVLPGYTHLQRAQPVLLAHWALAYAAMLGRDAERLGDALGRVDVCPLGSGALAGTAYKIDREKLAKDLGFSRASENSLDAVSDRDFAVEVLAAVALLGVHLSRLGEDLVLYGSGEFGFFEYDDAFSSGSSLMPQKKNPDAAELLRGKAGRAFGALVALLAVLKGLPLAYNKDLQEDKEPLFDAVRQAKLTLRAVPRIFLGVKVRREACLAAALGGHSNATDLADYLVGKGVPFREAHEQVGACVRVAIDRGVTLDALPVAVLREHAPACGADVYKHLTVESGLRKREVSGGTGGRAVRTAIRDLARELKA
jgi:argininosuccinate lyase/amino-acid N-acetyltransferase